MSQRPSAPELELFLESLWPSTVTEVTRLDAKPKDQYVGTVVDIDNLPVGDELVLDLNDAAGEERVILLTKRNHSGMQSWWKFQWSECEGHEQRNVIYA
jgi:hypothetical protein